MSTTRKYLIGIIAASLASVIAVIATATINPDLNPLDYIFLKPTEHSAKYYPEDTYLYTYLTLYPRGQQRKNMLALWERFSDLSSFNRSLEEQKEELEDQTGISLDNDVMPAVGPDLSFGILGFDNDDNPIMAGTMSVRDEKKAEILLEQALDYIEDEHGLLFDKDDYRDHPVWLDVGDEQAYALTENLIVAVRAKDDSAYWLEEMLDLIQDDSRTTLADNDIFQEAMSQLPRGRFASAYLNNEDHMEFSTEYNFFSNFMPQETLELLTPPWEAFCLQYEERAISITEISPIEQEYSTLSLENPARLLPEDTFVYLAFADDYDMDKWQEDMEDIPMDGLGVENWIEIINLAIKNIGIYHTGEKDPPLINKGAYADEVLASSLQIIEDLIGIDTESEFFDHLGNETVIALEQFDIEDFSTVARENPINASVIVEHQQESEEELDQTLRKFSRWLRDNHGVDTDIANVGAEKPARLIEIPDNRGMLALYQPGYVLNKGHIVMGTTEEILEKVVAVQNGEEPPLTSNREHSRAMELLPEGTWMIGWINLEELVGDLKPNDQWLSRNQYRAIRNATGTMAIAGHQDGTPTR